MADFEAWIADCHLKEFEGDGEYKCQAAVWADCYDAFRDTLINYLKVQGLGIVWLEEVLPAGQYLARHGVQHRQLGELAQAAHPGNPVEIGRMAAIGADGEPEKESYLSRTEYEFEPLPDQSGIPFWGQEWIAPELKDLLFGQLEDGTPLRTYFIVDSTLRKNITGIFDLDAVDIPVQCLFKGDAAEELKELAPYIVDMTLPEGAWDDRDKVPAFHKDFFARHWEQNTGIFIRTPAHMGEILGHFRKFTKVQNDDGKWLFFRFWDPKITSYFLHKYPEMDRRLWCSEELEIHKFLCAVGASKAVEFTPVIRNNEPHTLSGTRIQALSVEYLRDKRKHDILEYYASLSPKRFRGLGEDKSMRFMDHLFDEADRLQITTYNDIAYFGQVMQAFGSWVHYDPCYAPVLGVFNDEEEIKNPHRINRLYERVQSFTAACIGEKMKVALAASERLLTDFEKGMSAPVNYHSSHVIASIERHYPQRFEYAQPRNIQALFAGVHRYAEQEGFSKDWHKAVFAFGGFTLGYGFTRDPLLPWVEEILADQKLNKDEQVMAIAQYAIKRAKKLIPEIKADVMS